MSPEDASFIVESETEVRPEVIRALSKGKSLAVSSLLRVMDRAGPEARRIIAESFRGELAEQDRVLDALYRLALDDASPVRQAAIESLEKLGTRRAAILILRLADEEGASSAPTPLLRDPSASVRLAAVEALAALTQPQAGDLLLSSINDPDEKVSDKALKALVDRRDKRFLDPLLSFVQSIARDDRRQYWYSRIGYRYCGSQAPRFFEMFRSAVTPTEKADYRELVAGCEMPLRSEVRAALKKYAEDSDAEIRERARTILQQARKDDRRRSGSPAPYLLLIASVMSAFLGFLFFLWAFRLLKLRSLLEGAGVSKARSIALGTVAVSGDAQPQGGYLKHPYTGELCVWYRGASAHHPEHRFYVEDETGRLLVDPRDAVLLSEDGVISPGERVHIVATAKRSAACSGTPENSRRVVLGRTDEPRPLFQRVVDLLVGGLLGVAAGNRSIRRLFDNPRDVFWIWDDGRQKPMSSPREVALIFGVALSAGAWMVVFFLSTARAFGMSVL